MINPRASQIEHQSNAKDCTPARLLGLATRLSLLDGLSPPAIARLDNILVLLHRLAARLQPDASHRKEGPAHGRHAAAYLYEVANAAGAGAAVSDVVAGGAPAVAAEPEDCPTVESAVA